MYEALQLVGEGRGADLIRSSQWKKNQNGGELCVLGGRWVVNPSGGLESKGHPIGATGMVEQDKVFHNTFKIGVANLVLVCKKYPTVKLNA